jgi:hypothetical protein
MRVSGVHVSGRVVFRSVFLQEGNSVLKQQHRKIAILQLCVLLLITLTPKNCLGCGFRGGLSNQQSTCECEHSSGCACDSQKKHASETAIGSTIVSLPEMPADHSHCPYCQWRASADATFSTSRTIEREQPVVSLSAIEVHHVDFLNSPTNQLSVVDRSASSAMQAGGLL